MTDSKNSKTPKDSHYANLRRAYRDQKSGAPQPAFRPRPSVAPGDPAPDGLVRLYGIHTVRAALDNPRRKITRMLVTRNAAERLELGDVAALPFAAEIVEPRDIDRITGSDAVHQGVVIEAQPLSPKPLEALGDTRLGAARLDDLVRPDRSNGRVIPRRPAGPPEQCGDAVERRSDSADCAPHATRRHS